MADLDIYMILDGSGSMMGVKDDVVKGVNSFIEDQKDEKKFTGDDITFSLRTFDDSVVEHFRLEDVDLVPTLTTKHTFRGGTTALLDAIGKTLGDAKLVDRTSKKIVVVYTDGLENASREYSQDQIKKMVEELTATGDWQFIYMSAELEDFSQPANLGIAAGNTVTGTTRGTTSGHFHNLSRSASYYRTDTTAPSPTLMADADIDWEGTTGGTVGTSDTQSSKLWVPGQEAKEEEEEKDE